MLYIYSMPGIWNGIKTLFSTNHSVHTSLYACSQEDLSLFKALCAMSESRLYWYLDADLAGDHNQGTIAMAIILAPNISILSTTICT